MTVDLAMEVAGNQHEYPWFTIGEACATLAIAVRELEQQVCETCDFMVEATPRYGKGDGPECSNVSDDYGYYLCSCFGGGCHAWRLKAKVDA